MIQKYNEEGICTRQVKREKMESSGEYFIEYNEKLSDLARSPEFYSPRF